MLTVSKMLTDTHNKVTQIDPQLYASSRSGKRNYEV